MKRVRNIIIALPVILLVTVVLLAAVGPMIVQDATSGNSGGALDNIQASIDSLNDALEDSPVGDAFEAMDAIQ